MPAKICEVCGCDFHARTSVIRTCGVACRNRLIASEKEARHKSTKSCCICSNEFVVGASEWKRETCSPECAYRLRASKTSSRVEMSCSTCGTGFKLKLSESAKDTKKYCSKSCMYDRNKAQMTRACKCCGADFSTPPSQDHVETCSTECGYRMRESHNEKPKMVFRCEHCEVEFIDDESKLERRRFCSVKCMNDSAETIARKVEQSSGEKNGNWKGGIGLKVTSNTGKIYTRMPSHMENEKNVRRKRVKLGATPAWADLKKIRDIYRICRKVSEFTGIVHHVDHVVPLTSSQVCGLHCEANLQILPGEENLKKHNRTWPNKP